MCVGDGGDLPIRVRRAKPKAFQPHVHICNPAWSASLGHRQATCPLSLRRPDQIGFGEP